MIKPGESYSQNIRQEVIKAYNEGWTYAQITRKYGVSHQTISTWIKKNGIMQDRKYANWNTIRKKVLGDLKT